MFNRIFLIVLDGFGIGSAKDASLYGDEGANTALHVLDNTTINYSSLKQLGLYNLLGKSNDKTIGYYTSSGFVSQGKSSLVGHHEMMGVETKKAHNIFKGGFPADLVETIETKLNIKVLGNKLADGVAIMNELAEEHIKTGGIIVYTSADSVLQVAAHTNVIKLDKLYDICKTIKDITDEKEEWKVARVIARPFNGERNRYLRTSNRKDFVSKLPYKSVLNYLKDSSYEVISIGKVGDLFNNSGFTKKFSTTNNLDGLNKTVEAVKSDFSGLCFVNLSDLDTLFGHRRDVFGYSKALKEIDDYLPLIINATKTNDLVIITSDHGDDPTYEGNDHTRENVPVFIYSKRFVDPKKLDDFETVADIGATIADIFDVNNSEIGTSILNKLQ